MEVKERARTRRAIVKQQKIEKKKYLKSEAILALKRLAIIAVCLLVAFIIFIIIEVNRFNNHPGIEPGIVRGGEYVDNIAILEGFGYTVTYEYNINFTENTTLQEFEAAKILSGEFKLFNKISLSKWIE